MPQDALKINHHNPQRRGSVDPLLLARLRERLELVDRSFQASHQIQNDPISMVMTYPDPRDREVVALIAAALAYGNVRQIQASLRRIFDLLGPHPAQTLLEKRGSFWKQTVPRSFKHRFNNAEDLGILLTWIGEALRQEGTLERFFMKGLNIHKNVSDVGPALDSFVKRMISLPCKPFKGPTKGTLFLLSRPSNKSACKRMLLFLRWVTGSGKTDLGLWTRLPRRLLLIPVDTHVLRIARHLGLTKRKDNSWRTSQEITSKLRLLDSQDPVRFDFALCHLGISQECPSRFEMRICQNCRMKDLCQTYTKASLKSSRSGLDR